MAEIKIMGDNDQKKEGKTLYEKIKTFSRIFNPSEDKGLQN